MPGLPASCFALFLGVLLFLLYSLLPNLYFNWFYNCSSTGSSACSCSSTFSTCSCSRSHWGGSILVSLAPWFVGLGRKGQGWESSYIGSQVRSTLWLYVVMWTKVWPCKTHCILKDFVVAGAIAASKSNNLQQFPSSLVRDVGTPGPWTLVACCETELAICL